MALLPTEAAAGNPFACEPDAAAEVVDVFPSASVLPANLLRFYVYFSAPMNREQVVSAVRLVDDAGTEIAGVFLPTRYALWSSDSRRLTLVVDPGRVKTGLNAHTALGRALEPGRSYSLRVEARALDRQGCEIAAAAQKSFVVTDADTDRPRPVDWTLTGPVVGTRESLLVRLNGPHDHVSLAYGLRVQDASGAVVAGAVTLLDAEALWRFTPARAWDNAAYTLVVRADVEDLAGNRADAAFDQAANSTNGTPAVRKRAFTPTTPTT